MSLNHVLEKSTEYGKDVAEFVNWLEDPDNEYHGFIYEDVITSYGKCTRITIPKLWQQFVNGKFDRMVLIARENMYGPAQHYDKTNEKTCMIIDSFRNSFVENVNNKKHKDIIVYLETPWQIETNVIIDLYNFVI